LENNNVRVWLESVSFTLEEFVLELDPMETKAMKEALKHIQDHQDTECHGPESWPEDDTQNNGQEGAISFQDHFENKVQEYLCKLTMGQRKSPKTKI